jgi:hypothetical protein
VNVQVSIYNPSDKPIQIRCNRGEFFDVPAMDPATGKPGIASGKVAWDPDGWGASLDSVLGPGLNGVYACLDIGMTHATEVTLPEVNPEALPPLKDVALYITYEKASNPRLAEATWSAFYNGEKVAGAERVITPPRAA